MHSEDSDNELFGCLLFSCLSLVLALLGRRKLKRPQLSSNPSPLGQGGPSSSSMNSNINQTSGPSLDLSPLVHGGPSSISMESNIIMQSSPPSSHVSLSGQGGPISTSMDSNINQTIGPSSDLSLLGLEGTTSSSSNSIRSCRYDVFISFRVIDTRNTFVDHLYYHLIRKGLFVFKDDERLQKGELISAQLVQAIKDSRISIVVFSKDYASSSWCLDEMAAIADCHQQFKQSVLPVFYDVDPSHVRKQNGVYENAFVLHDEKFQQDPSKVDRWKTAMTILGNLAGWDVRKEPESTMIQIIVQEVIEKLKHKISWFKENLIRLCSNPSSLGQGGPFSSSLDSDIMLQCIPPSSDVNLLGQDGPTSTPMDFNSNQTSGPSLLRQEGTTSSSSNRVRSYRYHVFISFRGPDTRNTFVDHLYHHLIRRGIFVFKDDVRLQKGELISPQLVQAIQDSWLSIVVFSKDYASSSWCLDEMAAIADCHQQFTQTVLPVFYDVDPSHVRKQTGVYENAFVLHDEKFQQDPSKVDRWKTAMTILGNLAGWYVRKERESTMIQEIVQVVIKKLNHKFSWFAKDLIGIQPRVEELEKLLKLSSANDDFRVLGIWGMGGIGKSTHATVLFDKISYGFDACCFIENVSRIYRDGGVVAVQKQILHQTVGEINLETYSPFEISGIVRLQLHNLKVLIVLDNVDHVEQLQNLAIDPKLLHTGSRMIITTRDEHILRVYGVDVIHEVPLLNKNDAHELFFRIAVKSKEQSSKCMELIPEVLKYAQCLPLAIKVLGSSFYTRDATQWRDFLDRLAQNPDNNIMDVLEMSVDGLQYEDREIFLHIACFFKGEREEYVRRILDACALHSRIGIQNLIEKSLITIKNEEIHMHEMLQKLGEKIVRHNCPDEPELWSKVWQYEDFHRLFMTETETIKVKAIVLNQKEEVLECEAHQLSKLVHLQLLILYHKTFIGELEFLSNNLRFLLWHECPLLTLPLKFAPYYLVELNMPYSNIRQLWKGCKRLPCLKRMDLSYSEYLTETPNFEGVTALERLDLTGCTSLCHVHPSIGSLSKLVFLSLRNCINLEAIDFGRVCNLCSLRLLRLSGCSKLENTPDFTGASLNLEYLDMDGCTSLSLVHESIGALTKLRFLSMRDCTDLVSIPSNINTMTSLLTLDFYGCSKLGNLPLISAVSSSSNLKCLISLDLSFCHLHAVLDAIGELSCLERLNLQGNNLYSLPSSITQLSRLAYLNLSHCHELESLPILSTTSASSVGRYFTTSGSRDHRSGFHVFDCPKVNVVYQYIRPQFKWLTRLLKEPRHFRCGFDIVSPYNHRKDTYFKGNPLIETWFDHIFRGDSIIRVVHCDVDDNWIGFLFSVEFEAEYLSTISSSPHHSSSSPLPHPFYLSFETECIEQRFDMPLKLELAEIRGSRHIWTIYISRQHCHFIETGAHITFKACPGLVVKNWGLRRIVKQDIDLIEKISRPPSCNKQCLVIDNVEKSSSSFGPKIQLPYNWPVTE